MLAVASIHAEPPAPCLSQGASQRQRGTDLGCRDGCLPPQLALLGNVQPAVSGRQLQMTSDASFKRRVRSRMAKTGEAYTTARARLDRRAPTAATRRVLHVTNGDSVAGTLAASGVVGQVLAWRDVLFDGPVPGVLTPQELRRVRAAHLAARYEGDVAVIDEELAKRDRMLDAYANGEYRLWFEADLHDQLQLVQVLDRLRRIGVDPVRIMLISVGEYRGIAHFMGLGELHADQLGALVDEAVTLSCSLADSRAGSCQLVGSIDHCQLRAGTRSPRPGT